MTRTRQPALYIFSGLPGAGKSTLAQAVAARLGCVYLRIDTIEQALRDLCSLDVEGEGYQLSYRIAADNLTVGLSVVADACNAIELTRNAWEDVARNCGAMPFFIEICCSDKREHQGRIDTRICGVPGLQPPSWPEVEQREYHDWTRERIVVDTAGRTVAECLDQLCEALVASQLKFPEKNDRG
jgi:predicted kinase